MPQPPGRGPTAGCVALGVTGLMLVPEPPGGTMRWARFQGAMWSSRGGILVGRLDTL